MKGKSCGKTGSKMKGKSKGGSSKGGYGKKK